MTVSSLRQGQRCATSRSPASKRKRLILFFTFHFKLELLKDAHKVQSLSTSTWKSECSFCISPSSPFFFLPHVLVLCHSSLWFLIMLQRKSSWKSEVLDITLSFLMYLMVKYSSLEKGSSLCKDDTYKNDNWFGKYYSSYQEEIWSQYCLSHIIGIYCYDLNQNKRFCNHWAKRKDLSFTKNIFDRPYLLGFYMASTLLTVWQCVLPWPCPSPLNTVSLDVHALRQWFNVCTGCGFIGNFLRNA